MTFLDGSTAAFDLVMLLAGAAGYGFLLEE